MARLAALVLAALSAACASGSRPWVVDGREVGVVRTREAGDRVRHEYVASSGLVMRVEWRLGTGELDPLAVVERREYDALGRQVLLTFTDVDGRPTAGPFGYATRRTTYHPHAEGGTLVELRHVRADGTPFSFPAGYSCERQRWAGGRLDRRSFHGPGDVRVAARLRDTDGVWEIRYAYLQGATPIVMELFVDRDGAPLARHKVAGHTRLRTDHWYVDHPATGLTNLYAGTWVTASSDPR